MPAANLMLRSARSRRSSCVVPSKDCFSNSAAAADTNAEQRLRFYRCNSERRREAKRNKYPWGAAAQKGSQFVIRHDMGYVLRTRGIWYQMEIRIARKEVKKPLVSSGSFAHFSSCWEKWAVGDKTRIISPGCSREASLINTRPSSRSCRRPVFLRFWGRGALRRPPPPPCASPAGASGAICR